MTMTQPREATTACQLKPPFPWFGGKIRAANHYLCRFEIAPRGRLNFCSLADCVPSPALYASNAWVNWLSVHVGGRPVRFVLLFVDHLRSFLAAFKDAVVRSINSGRCMSRCSDLLTSSRLSRSSFNLLRSLWWMPNPRGINPCACSHTNLERRTQVLGSAIFINARCSPFLL